MNREWQALIHDRWSRALLFWLPLSILLCLWWTLSASIVRDLPVAIIDLDKSSLSRQFAQQLDASSSFYLSDEFSSVMDGAQALKAGQVYALVVIPRHFERDIRLGTMPTVTAWNNGQFILIAKVLNTSLASIAGTFNAKVGTAQALAKGAAFPQTEGMALPVRNQITPLFNMNSSYAQFLLSAIIPAAWAILLALSGINTLSREDKQGRQWMPTKAGREIGAKFMVNWLIGWAWGGVWAYGMYSLLDYPLVGSPLLLFLVLGVAAGACIALGLFFFAALRDSAKTISIVGALTAPGLAFMGITFPASAMETFATYWRALLPVSHYADIQIAISNYGSGITRIYPSLIYLTLFWGLIPLSICLYKKRAIKDERC